jgi:hypothetical protein
MHKSDFGIIIALLTFTPQGGIRHKKYVLLTVMSIAESTLLVG